MKDYDELYLVKIYLNDELIYIEHFVDKTQALKSGEFWETKGYKCEVHIYQSVEIIERGEEK